MTPAARRSSVCLRLRSRLVVGLVAAAMTGSASGQSDAFTAGAAEIFEAITVVAGRAEQRLGEVAGTASVVDRDELDRRQVQGLDDLVRYEPGVAATGTAGRFGVDGLRIRGMGGNRVGIELDGVPVGDGFAIGSFSSAGRDRVEPELLRRVEILRGPASALYGSDALAGVVALTTREPGDLLVAGRRAAGELRLGIDGRDHGRRASFLGAASAGRWSVLGLATRRSAEALDNRGAVRPDPSDAQRDSAFARLARTLDRGWLELTVEHRRARIESDVRHLVGQAGQFASTDRLLADDREKGDHTSLVYALSTTSPRLTSGELRLYRSRSGFDQRTRQWRHADLRTPEPTRRDRRFQFDQEQRGIEWTGRSSFDAGGTLHQLVWGAEADRRTLEELRDGVETDLSSGAVTSSIIGEQLPVRDFPRSTTRAIGIFLVDDVALDDGRWRLQPALRYDSTTTRARTDAIYREDFPDLPLVDSNHEAVTAKLGVTHLLGSSGHHQVYLQIAQGFRAPPVYDVNIGLRIALFNYEAIPNPDLRPEHSLGTELGWRLSSRRLSAQVAIYDNRYRDLIESRVNLGADPVSGRILFQSLNRDRARIHGIEGRLRIDLGDGRRRALGWSLDGGFAWSRGDDTRRRVPLNSVDPARASLGVSHAAANDGWLLSMITTWTAAKHRIDSSSAPVFAPPSSQLIDLYARHLLGSRWTLDLALLNALDEKYWSYGKAAGLLSGDPQLDFHTEPGRALLVGVTLRSAE